MTDMRFISLENAFSGLLTPPVVVWKPEKGIA
jgi:hypothetical protein